MTFSRVWNRSMMKRVDKMSRFLFGLLLLGVAIFTGLFFYRTNLKPAESLTIATFGGVSLSIEFATTTTARERGLSGRSGLRDDYGMLFIFEKPDRYGFWMKDMLVPIDIFWLDDKGQVIFITPDVVVSTYPNVFYPPAPVRYVLETKSGFAREHRIATGALLMLPTFPTVLQ